MKLISGLAEGQVLQRLGKAGATMLLSGETDADGPVQVTIAKAGRPISGWNRRKVGETKRGRFTLKLASIPAGGPYRLRLETAGKDTESADVKAFYVGDVWILAGQSNMEGAGRLPSAARPHSLVRAFSQRREWRQALDPLHIHVESPDACHNYGRQITREMGEECRKRSSSGAGAGVPFGREMLVRSGVPQGLICVARGGSSMDLWNPGAPDQLYASMMASVRATGQPVAGVLWYQGESDISFESSALYTERMKTLVSAVRRDLRQPRLPWVMVQIARVFRAGTGEYWNSVQEQQRLLPGIIPDLATVAAIDLALDDEIHIGAIDMPRLGVRLARAADWLLNKTGKESSPPQLRAVRRTISTENSPGPKCGVDVVFDRVVGGIRADGEPAGFCLLDPQGVELPWIFKTTLHGDFARLHIMRLPPPGSMIAYGRGFYPRCNLTDGRDLALPVFAARAIEGDAGLMPFVTTWKVCPVVETASFIDTARKPEPGLLSTELKTYEGGFINEHEAWQRKSGHAFWCAALELDNAQTIECLMGYDGPFRMWLDGRSFFCNAGGTNPCIADESGKTVKLSAGRHEVIVGMDINHGRAWGFFLRFRLTGAKTIPIDGLRYTV